MNSILENGNNKSKCQKFTPNHLVDTMLELAGYNNQLIGKTVLENSFGSGNILKAIVVRYIESALNLGVDANSIARGLSEDIYGIELDKELYVCCINELNDIVDHYNLPSVKWKLFNTDALFMKLDIKFDFVIGNPPYISYKEMDKETRQVLQKAFKTCCKGKFDYCYAFIELGIKFLKKNGRLVQLIPNNIYKNVFAQELRNMLSDHISVVFDYPNQKLFDKALTSVSIFLYDNGSSSKNIIYENRTKSIIINIDRSLLKDKWVFNISNTGSPPTLRFGDIFHASITIATLCNRAFLVDAECISQENLEREMLQKAVSPKTLRYGTIKYIIFPYKYEKGVISHYSVDEFEKRFPNVRNHLKKYHRELSARDSDKNVAWFEYGRSQAISQLNSEKALLSTIITNKVEVYHLDAETIPYSGIIITVKDKKYRLEDAISILKSEQFMDYIRKIGISISGQSLRITCKDINNYRF